jgi:RNA polymerase sigma-70 factor (ECF subfamily)
MSFNEDRQEFARLIARHQRGIQSYIFANVPNWNDCDEVWQETCVRLWSEFGKYQPNSNFVGWAIRVAHFEVLTWRKKAVRSKVIFSQDFVDAIAADANRFASEGAQERLNALDQCLENLNSRHRKLLQDFYAPNSQVRLVAAMMDCSVEAVYKTLQRVRKMLRKCIQERLGLGPIQP